MTTVPADFVLHTRSSAVTKPWEPIYASQRDGSFRLGLIIADAHCNSRQMLHGGVIAALADNAMGLTLGLSFGHALSGSHGIVTTALSVDYFGLGKIGQWLEIAPRLVSASKSSGVVDALVSADGVAIVRANASFRILASSK
jgi:acyl-coenzyme A thioesterase PaaI-like protein